MNRNFERVMAHVFKHEGGYADHPSDPGGATNMGITLGTLSAWRGRKVGKAEVRALSRREAMKIYRRQYWHPVAGDDLPDGIDYAVFDFAVNSGPRRASEYLQRIAGVKVDGVIGLATLAAIRTMAADDVVTRLCSARLGYLKRIQRGRLWRTFGKGWQRRVDAVERDALKLAAEAAGLAGSQRVRSRSSLLLFILGRLLAAFSIFLTRRQS